MEPEPGAPRLAVQAAGGAAVAHLAGPRISLSDQVALALAPQFDALAEAHGDQPVFLHLGNVDFLCSTALGMIVKLHKRLQAAGGSLTMCSLPKDLYEIFTVTRLHTVLRIHRGPGRVGPPGVLVVERDRAIRTLLERALRPAGFAVWPAASEEEALALGRQRTAPVDLLLFDADVPLDDLSQTLAQLRRFWPQLRFCFLVADNTNSEAAFREHRADCIFVKPPAIGEIVLALHRLAALSVGEEGPP
jgi:anti-sigma B factor antagonist